MVLGQPIFLLAFPLALVLIFVLERWRRRPVLLEVADVSLFVVSPEAEAEARAQRQRLSQAFWLRVAAAAACSFALAAPRLKVGPEGALEVDLVLERGLLAGAPNPVKPAAGEGADRLAALRAQLLGVLDALKPGDRARVHLVPGPVATSLPRDEARALLLGATSVSAPADAGPLVHELAARRAAHVFLAACAPPSLGKETETAEEKGDQGAGEGFALALRAGPVRDRAIVGLAAASDSESLVVTLSSVGLSSPAAREVEVALSAERPDGSIRTHSLKATLPARGATRLTWTSADGFPSDALAASARIVPPAAAIEEVPGNDRAFAQRPADPTRRVGVVGSASEPVLRALRALAGVELIRLEQPPSALAAADLDLLVVANLPRELPKVALALVPTRLAEPKSAGGPLVAQSHPAFHHLAAQLSADSATVPTLGAPPEGLPSLRPLILAGDEPLVLLGGRGRELVAVARSPATHAAGTWVKSASFPVFWGELLELAAPRQGASLRAHPAGHPLPGWTSPPLEARRYLDADGRPTLGTVAALLPGPRANASAASQDFPPESIARLETLRPHGEAWPLAPVAALVALAFALAAWWPPRPRESAPEATRRSGYGVR